ncbi:hypothetical protein [Variovorax paradoxus]|uniref:hypothetical protein n=1 Tax=Variovorax paradoxus TaxID=34073 RepID=UPI0033939645
MKEPAAIDPEAKALLDEAFAEHSRSLQEQADAQTRAIQETAANMQRQGRELDQIVQPALQPLVNYLKEQRIEANVEASRGPSGTTVLTLIWGKTVKSSIQGYGPPRAAHNYFKAMIEPRGNLQFRAALRGDQDEALTDVPEPVNTQWVSKTAAAWIKKSLAGL